MHATIVYEIRRPALTRGKFIDPDGSHGGAVIVAYSILEIDACCFLRVDPMLQLMGLKGEAMGE